MDKEAKTDPSVNLEWRINERRQSLGIARNKIEELSGRFAVIKKSPRINRAPSEIRELVDVARDALLTMRTMLVDEEMTFEMILFVQKEIEKDWQTKFDNAIKANQKDHELIRDLLGLDPNDPDEEGVSKARKFGELFDEAYQRFKGLKK